MKISWRIGEDEEKGLLEGKWEVTPASQGGLF